VGEWKLLHFYEDNRDELHHLSADGSELRDVAAQEPVRTRELRRRLDDYLAEVGARLPARCAGAQMLSASATRALRPGSSAEAATARSVAPPQRSA
jgi:hypothetical protein